MVGMQFWDPAVAPRLAVGWAAMRDYLADRESASWVATKGAARKGSDLADKTCRNMLRYAERDGLVERVEGGKRKRYRLTAKGATTGAPRVADLDGAAGDR